MKKKFFAFCTWGRKIFPYIIGFLTLYNVLFTYLFAEELRLIAIIAGWNHVGITSIYDVHLTGSYPGYTIFYYLFYWLDSWRFRYDVCSILLITFLITAIIFIFCLLFLRIIKKIIEKKRGYKIVA